MAKSVCFSVISTNILITDAFNPTNGTDLVLISHIRNTFKSSQLNFNYKHEYMFFGYQVKAYTQQMTH